MAKRRSDRPVCCLSMVHGKEAKKTRNGKKLEKTFYRPRPAPLPHFPLKNDSSLKTKFERETHGNYSKSGQNEKKIS